MPKLCRGLRWGYAIGYDEGRHRLRRSPSNRIPSGSALSRLRHLRLCHRLRRTWTARPNHVLARCPDCAIGCATGGARWRSVLLRPFVNLLYGCRTLITNDCSAAAGEFRPADPAGQLGTGCIRLFNTVSAPGLLGTTADRTGSNQTAHTHFITLES